MTTPHVIRLRGPWQFEPLARTVLLPDGRTVAEEGVLPAPGRMQMPADWSETLGTSFRGRVLYLRRFNCPTGLTDQHRVDLVLVQADALAIVTLNDTKLGEFRLADPPARFDITPLLQDGNLLRVQVELPRIAADSAPLPRAGREDLPGGLIGEVRLEIFEPGLDEPIAASEQ